QALMNADIEQMTEVHHCLSRNGFYQVLEAALSKLPQDALLNAKTRCNDWLNLAKQKAEQASGYPEAYDFKKAGIDIHQFQALKDVSHFLNSKS
ncbi:MAG: hypothetical protein OEZ38_07575, partial [Gammaproteobacteria bacterium]|nr:hypothetical protein [Gammaproteobacteria bacterium]